MMIEKFLMTGVKERKMYAKRMDVDIIPDDAESNARAEFLSEVEAEVGPNAVKVTTMYPIKEDENYEYVYWHEQITGAGIIFTVFVTENTPKSKLEDFKKHIHETRDNVLRIDVEIYQPIL